VLTLGESLARGLAPVKTRAEVAASALGKIKVELAKMDAALKAQAAVNEDLRSFKATFETHVRETVGVSPSK